MIPRVSAMRQPRFLLVVVLGALIGAGCNPQVPQSTNDGQSAAELKARLTGTWRLETLHGEAVGPFDSGQAAPTLTLSPDGKVSGSGGCNRFSTTYEHQDREIGFGRIVATKMACPGTTAMEREYFGALNEARRYRIRDGGLELLNDQGDVLGRLRPDKAAGPGEND